MKKLKKYDVLVKVHTEYWVTVEAENEAEAKTQAFMNYDSDIELYDKDNTRVVEIEIEEIKEEIKEFEQNYLQKYVDSI